MSAHRTLDWDELAAWRASGRDFALIDVRSAEEVASGAVADARHLPWEALERYAPFVLPDKARTVVCYCASGKRSAVAARWLVAHGYADVWNVAEGYRGD